MDELIVQLREAEKLALRLKESELKKAKESQENPTEVKKEPPSSSDGDWLDALRDSLGSIDEPLTVLSLFDGIGGIWAALNRLCIPFIGYSSEINPYGIQVVKTVYPNVTHLGDVKDIRRGDISEEVDLVVGGFPCQDLSCMGKRNGLHGSRSRLFFDMLRILHVFKPKWFLAENVASMTWVDRDEISKYLRCHPIEIDSQELTVNKRKRIYWTNIPYPKKLPQVKEHKSNLLQSVIDNATALEEKIGCITQSNYHVGGKAQLQRVFDHQKKELRYITITEVEKIMGFSPGHTDVDFSCKNPDLSEWDLDTFGDEADDQNNGQKTLKRKCSSESLDTVRKESHVRWGLLGNSFSVPVISYMLSPLLDPKTWDTHKAHNFSETFKENECSVMDRGEVWALYNTHERPNWYAVILDRVGGRFAPSQNMGRKRLLNIQACFLEMDPDYLADEADKWSPNRGTGLYKRTDSPDIQDTWVTFSHRMVNLRRIEESYFVYPGKDEVWGVFDHGSKRPTTYFVYVNEAELDWSQVQLRRPGYEGFVAHCTLMQQTAEPQLFRCTGTKLVCKDLGKFCFNVPYYFKSEAGLFKLELSQKGRRHLPDGTSSTRGTRARKKKGQDADTEEDDEALSDAD